MSKIEFFNPEDFKVKCEVHMGGLFILNSDAADQANEKLEKEASVVYSAEDKILWSNELYPTRKYKACLIGVTPIEKCTHPPEKVNNYDGKPITITKEEQIGIDKAIWIINQQMSILGSYMIPHEEMKQAVQFLEQAKRQSVNE